MLCRARVDVPTDKRLVIEHLSGWGRLPIGQRPYALTLSTRQYVVPHFMVSGDAFDYIAFNEPLKGFVGAGAVLEFFACRPSDNTSGGGDVTATMTGYLIPLS